MNFEDFTIDPGFATAIAAIIAPTITALIHSIKEYRIAHMTCIIKPRLEQFKQFSNCYEKCKYGLEKTGYIQSFCNETMNLIPLCGKKSTRHSLFLLSNEVGSNGASEATDKLFKKCIQMLSKEI